MKEAQSRSPAPSGAPPLEIWDDATLVRRLIEAEKQLPDEIRDRIIAQGERIVPALIAVLEDDTLADTEAPGDGYAPLHAIDLLAELKAVRAIPTLLALAMDYDWQTLRFNNAVLALKSYGEVAYAPVLEAFRENDDPEIEPVLVEILAILGRQDEELYEILVGYLRDNPERGAQALAEYGDPRALPLLAAVYDGLKVPEGDDDSLWGDQPIIEVAQAIEDLGGSLTAAQQDRLDRVRSRRREKASLMRAYLDQAHGELSPAQKVRPLGRNDPCWCGSGKKHKKCHLDLDREAGL